MYQGVCMKRIGVDENVRKASLILTAALLCCALTTKVCLADMGSPSGSGALLLFGVMIAYALTVYVSIAVGIIGIIMLIRRLCHKPYGKALGKDVAENLYIIFWLIAGILTSFFFIGVVVYAYGLRKAVLYARSVRGGTYNPNSEPDPKLDDLTEKLKDSEEYFGRTPQTDAQASEKTAPGKNYYGDRIMEDDPGMSPAMKALLLGGLIGFVGILIIAEKTDADLDYVSRFWLWMLILTTIFLAGRIFFKTFGGAENSFRYDVRPNANSASERDEQMRRQQELNEQTAIHINRRMPREEEQQEPRENKPW